jgi:hypothetical protein
VRAGWIEAVGSLRPAPKFALLEARRGARLAGAVPAFLTTRFSRRWLHSMPFGTYGGALIAEDDADPGAVRAALAAALAAGAVERRFAGGDVIAPPAASDAGAPDPAWARVASATTRLHAHRIDLAVGVDALEAVLRRETRKGFRHAERAGVRVSADPGALEEVHDLYRTQATEWNLHHPYPIAFLRALVEHPSHAATLWVARSNERVHAGILALSGGSETFLWWSGADPASRVSLAYPLLIWAIVRDAAARGERWVNLGASGGRAPLHRFKESLGGAAYPFWIYHLMAGRSDWVGRAVQWARAMRRRA